ncbi:Uncharacterised protein [Mycobacteroides abscessus subsp. abscessus]|nr:Uncharacterised protein [Mycobacteroides abscessus subsp. abscessus]
MAIEYYMKGELAKIGYYAGYDTQKEMWVGTCPHFPHLSFETYGGTAALAGIKELVAAEIEKGEADGA